MQSPWLLHLDHHGARFAEGGSVRLAFAEPREEVRRAANTTTATPLTHLGLLRVSGADAASFLHNMLSNDIKKLQTHHAQRSSLNSPKGRMLASFVIWREGADYLLQLSADLAAAIQRKLTMYVLRSQAKVADATSDLAVIGLAGPRVATVLDALGLGLPPEPMQVTGEQIKVVRLDAARVQLVTTAAKTPALWDKLMALDVDATGSLAWDWLDIQAGLPLITAALQDEFVAQMLNFELIGGVDFQKGCYPGQEIVARTQYLGKLKKRLYRASLETDAPAVGTDVYGTEFGEQSAGKILMASPGPETGSEVLVVLQTVVRESGAAHLGSPDGALLRFEALPYAVT